MYIEEFELEVKNLFIKYRVSNEKKDWFVVKVRSLYKKKQVSIIMMDFIGSQVRFDALEDSYPKAFKMVLGFAEERFIGWFNKKGWELPNEKR